MPVMTKGQYQKGLAKPIGATPAPEDIVAPVIAEEPILEIKKPVVDKVRVRMHHPDDPYKRMNTEFTLDGAKIKIVNGVATVPRPIAMELERRGWLRGSEVEYAQGSY